MYGDWSEIRCLGFTRYFMNGDDYSAKEKVTAIIKKKEINVLANQKPGNSGAPSGLKPKALDRQCRSSKHWATENSRTGKFSVFSFI